MTEKPDKSPIADIEAVIRKESEEALRRFRSGDFASRLSSRLASSQPRRPFVLFRKPVLVPALGVLALAAVVVVLLVLATNGGKGRVEAGFRFMTDVLGRSEYFRTADSRALAGGPGETSARPEITPFAAAIFRAAAGSSAAPGPIVLEKNGPPLRPLFNPDERFKILYGDKAILRVLVNIMTQKEV